MVYVIYCNVSVQDYAFIEYTQNFEERIWKIEQIVHFINLLPTLQKPFRIPGGSNPWFHLMCFSAATVSLC